MGGAMGWTPEQVGACGLGDFVLAFEGWREAQGGNRSDEPSPEEREQMRIDLEHYRAVTGAK